MRIFDVLRGLSVVSMVLFHFCYDLTAIQGTELPWFKPPLEDLWRASISWVFLILAGIMCAYSRSNFRRSLVYGVFALLIWVVTTLAKVDVPISFGIIYCMFASTLAYAALERLGVAPRGIAAAGVLFVCFVLCLGISSGSIGLADARLRLPRCLYETKWLSWLGFPGPGFSSGDYYPPLPYSLIFLAGAAIGPGLKERLLGTPLARVSCPALEIIGRNALAVYVVHQPVLLLLSGFVS
ncbi:MAG: heparan-alpha-glucosaminide N-acetyltransferase [Coriobacteriia bacterium]|nr:heparan-alpha-glucosaminide N-acetyltransferase [Coriobacteriia bacterium]